MSKKTKRIFNTPTDGERLRTGTTRSLTRGRRNDNDNDHDNDHHHDHHHHHHHNKGIKVKKFRAVRVAADNRARSATAVTFNLFSTPSNNGRSIRIARFRLAPGTSYSGVFDVPGQFLNITATSAPTRNLGTGCNRRRRRNIIDVDVYGR